MIRKMLVVAAIVLLLEALLFSLGVELPSGVWLD